MRSRRRTGIVDVNIREYSATLMSFMLLNISLFLRIIVGLITSNWIIIILMMELGLFFFIFICREYVSLRNSRACIKYFFPQSVGSLLVLISGLLIFTFHNIIYSFACYIFLLGLLLKLGAFPIFFWVIPVRLNLPYAIIGVVGCPLKILPLAIYIRFFFIREYGVYFINIVRLLTIVVGVWLGLNIKTIRGILGASSVRHTGWFIMSIHTSTFIKYFLLYTVRFVLVLWAISIHQLFWGAVNLLSLAGLPPFSVFVAKMLVVSDGLACNLPIIFLVSAVLVSALSLYYYIKFRFNIFIYSGTEVINRTFIYCLMVLLNRCAALLFCLFFYGRVGNRFLIYSRDFPYAMVFFYKS